MKVNSITKYNVQNNKPSFNASLQLSGNTNLLVNDGVATLQEFVSRIGSRGDFIDIALPMSNKITKNNAKANIAGWVNGTLKQFPQSIEKTDVLGSLIKGLKSNYIVNEINFDAWKEVFDLKDKETFESLERLRNFANFNGAGKEFRFDSIEDMLERINAPITIENERIIHYAALRNTDLLKICLKHPNINVNAQNCLGDTPLHWVSHNLNEESIKLLLERDDVDTTIKNVFNRTAEQNCYGDAYYFWDEYAKNGYKKFW